MANPQIMANPPFTVKPVHLFDIIKTSYKLEHNILRVFSKMYIYRYKSKYPSPSDDLDYTYYCQNNIICKAATGTRVYTFRISLITVTSFEGLPKSQSAEKRQF